MIIIPEHKEGPTPTIGEWADYLHEHTRGLPCGDPDCPINSGAREPDWAVLYMLFGGILPGGKL
jgi:hypothetical protein